MVLIPLFRNDIGLLNGLVSLFVLT